ncbi:MAG: response regulator [Planctomycetota bacterium]|jgi:DNA-binding NarL/FixJ family response regulator
MLVFGGQKYESIFEGDKVKTSVADIRATNARSRTTASLLKVRRDKVLSVRQQLAEGKYCINERLNMALDRLIEGLITRRESRKTMKKTQDKTSKNKIRILVVDDHAIVRQGLIKLIEAECDLKVCTEAENVGQAMEAVEKQQFDLAIVDISLEGTSGLELTERMKLRCPNLIVLILSMHDGLLYAQRALRAGASGYVAKYEAAEKIITAIRRVLSGKIYVSDSRAVKAMPDAASISDDSLNANKITEIPFCNKSEHENTKHAQRD